MSIGGDHNTMNLRFSKRLHHVRVILAFLAACVLVSTGAYAGDKSHNRNEYRRHDGREYRRDDVERIERAREMRERAYIAGAVDQQRRDRERDYYDRDNRDRYYRNGYDQRYRERYHDHDDHDDDDDDKIEGALIGAAVGAILTGAVMSNTNSPR